MPEGKDLELETKPPAQDNTDWVALAAMTEEEGMAAALSDPDAQPWPEGKELHRVAKAKWIRFKMVLGQEDFAERYHIPLATLIPWERHEAQPDVVALAFLDAIGADPEGVANALAKSSQPAQAAE
jgi:putative transcriptional regulator